MGRWLASCAVLCGIAVPLAADEEPLATLTWITGTWKTENGTTRMEETWTGPEGGLILGVHRELLQGDRTFFEYLRIEQREDELVYIASKGGKHDTEYRLAELSNNHVVFENGNQDFPRRIAYTRNGDSLEETVEGVVGGEPRSFVLKWRPNPRTSRCPDNESNELDPRAFVHCIDRTIPVFFETTMELLLELLKFVDGRVRTDVLLQEPPGSRKS